MSERSDEEQQREQARSARGTEVLDLASIAATASLLPSQSQPHTRRQEIPGTEESQSIHFDSGSGQQESGVRTDPQVTTEVVPSMSDDPIDSSSSVPVGGGLSTMEDVSKMFKDASPVERNALAGGSCVMSRAARGDDQKTINKNKDRCCVGLKNKFKLNHFQLTGKALEGEEDDDPTSKTAPTTTDAIISVTYLGSELKQIF